MLLSYIDGVTFHCCFSITLIDKHQRINNTTKIERRKSKEYLFYDASSFYDKLYPVSRTTAEADGGGMTRELLITLLLWNIPRRPLSLGIICILIARTREILFYRPLMQPVFSLVYSVRLSIFYKLLKPTMNENITVQTSRCVKGNAWEMKHNARNVKKLIAQVHRIRILSCNIHAYLITLSDVTLQE